MQNCLSLQMKGVVKQKMEHNFNKKSIDMFTFLKISFSYHVDKQQRPACSIEVHKYPPKAHGAPSVKKEETFLPPT